MASQIPDRTTSRCARRRRCVDPLEGRPGTAGRSLCCLGGVEIRDHRHPMIAAVGWGERPATTRARSRSVSWTRCLVPVRVQRRLISSTVLYGGKSAGRCAQAIPPRHRWKMASNTKRRQFFASTATPCCASRSGQQRLGYRPLGVGHGRGRIHPAQVIGCQAGRTHGDER